MSFIVFEGLDGSGKSTLISQLTQELTKRGQSFVQTREPGGTPLAEDIRQLLLRNDDETPVAPTELLLYAASRAQHVARVIAPALERGEWVICDRFAESMVAFQCFARGASREDVNWLNRFAQQGRSADLVVLLDLPVEESLRRLRERQRASNIPQDRMEREDEHFHRKVREGYLTQAKEEPWRWMVLDAMQKTETSYAALLKELEKRKWLK